MRVEYKTAKIKKICTDLPFCKKNYGLDMAIKIATRIEAMKSCESKSDLMKIPGRCHPLKHNRAGQYGISLTEPARMVIELDETGVIFVTVIEITDYHKKG